MTATLHSLAADLAAGRTTSRALVEDCLARTDDPTGEGARVFLKTDVLAARAAAEAMDRLRAAGLAPSLHAGIPISVKDLFDIAGEVTTAGSRVLADAAPAERDAPAIARLKAQGFIVVGRTNMTEFAFSGLGLNPHFGTPRNPFDRETGRIPGGSSSGAAVSVTDGMAHAAIGTDTGGSCRIPAALCGLVGFKPTARRVPLDGAVPLAQTLDSVGPIARSVACCRVLDAVMAGMPPADRAAPEVDLGGLRFAVPQTMVLDDMDEHVAALFARALDRLSRAGAKVTEIPLAEFGEIAQINVKGGFPAAEGYAWHRELIEAHAADYDPRVLVRLLRGRGQDAADYITLCQERRKFVGRIEARIGRFDALVLPTVPCVAPAISALTEDDEAYTRINLLMLRNSTVVNMFDGCAISLPMHAPGEAPAGLMLAARGGEDAQLLAYAQTVERVLGEVSRT